MPYADLLILRLPFSRLLAQALRVDPERN